MEGVKEVSEGTKKYRFRQGTKKNQRRDKKYFRRDKKSAPFRNDKLANSVSGHYAKLLKWQFDASSPLFYAKSSATKGYHLNPIIISSSPLLLLSISQKAILSSPPCFPLNHHIYYLFVK
jgi:hypothetical protein